MMEVTKDHLLSAADLLRQCESGFACNALRRALTNAGLSFEEAHNTAEGFLHPHLRGHGLSVHGSWDGADAARSYEESREVRAVWLEALAEQLWPTIPLSIQTLVRDACIATARQGRRAMQGETCLYDDGNGGHCVVGHALTPAILADVGKLQMGVSALAVQSDAARVHLGAEDQHVLSLWSDIQTAHDTTAEALGGKNTTIGYRPTGVSWGQFFWSKARNACQRAGFDLGAFPRHLMA